MTSLMFAGKRTDLPLSKGFANWLPFLWWGQKQQQEFCNHIFHLSKLHNFLANGRRTPSRAVLKWPNNSCHFVGDKREHHQSEERSSDWLPSPLPSHWSREDAQVTVSQLWEARGDNQVAKGRDTDTHGITDKGTSNKTGTYFFPLFLHLVSWGITSVCIPQPFPLLI